jgi:hypothetical protein
MSAVATIVHRDVWGMKFSNFCTIALDDSYPTGGEAIDLDEVELTDVDYVIFPENTSGYGFEWDDTNSKIKVYVEEAVAAGGPLVEAANTADLSALTAVKAIFVGTK